jgi:ATP/maltotriose-dependent transcriptional regulator MalT
MAVALDHPMTLGYVITYAAIIAAESDDLAGVTSLLDDADLLQKRLPERYLKVVLDALRGWVAVREGSFGPVEDIVRAVAISRAEGETLHLTYCLLLLARARALTGELDEGRVATREAIAWSQRRNQGYLEAELWRVDAELAYRSGQADAARAALRNATELAAAQGASWLELKALHSLASHFDDATAHARLAELVRTLPSGRDLPAVLAATDLLSRGR